MEIKYDQVKQELRLDRYKEFLEYDRMIERSCEIEWQDIVDKLAGTGLDPVDEASEELEKINMYKYRMQLMTIVCMYETWEQDLFAFLKEENLLVSDNNDFRITKSAFLNRFNEIEIDGTKLDEMRKIVNTIKHGSGSSFNQIVDLLGEDILADSNFGVMQEDGTTKKIKQRQYDVNALTSRTLNINGKIPEYYDEIISFWKKTFAHKENEQSLLKD